MSLGDSFRKRTWLEIDLDSIAQNYFQLKKLAKNKKICCVVKADAYGHGAIQTAKLFSLCGADMLAVSNIEESIQLRKANITLPIVIIGHTPIECAHLLCEFNLSQCVYSYSYGAKLNSYLKKINKKINIHLKIDTGMARIGFCCRDINCNALNNAYRICNFSNFIVEGIFTHLSYADGGKDGEQFTKTQCQNFYYAVKYLKDKGVRFKYIHCSDSAGLLDYGDIKENMVRLGIALYGLNPSNKVLNKVKLTPAMSLKSVVIQIKDLDIGQSLGYGCEFTASKKTKVATIPIGYADGLRFALKNKKGRVKINGKSAYILGRVCMDQIMVDITDINCSLGDEVEIFGKTPPFTADDMASILETINYEIVCSVGKRVPIKYIKGGETLCWQDGLVSEF